MTSDIYQLKQEINDAVGENEPPWKAYGRINIMTGVSLGPITEEDEVSDDQFEDVLQAAEEITGESFVVRQ
ncbi:hypothetical protein [Halovenus salina]|uniref:Uncharacterized protein n=1 Tax=Halovenus salina TaxID=1510225 RepID=A0ABD5W681_9EURY